MINKTIYKDTVIEVSIVNNSENSELKQIALRYLKPQDYTNKNGDLVKVSNVMNGETDWFILPHTFGAAIGKKLFEQKNAGLIGFEESGYKELLVWLIEMEIIEDAMCY